jgi:hypothetical protein
MRKTYQILATIIPILVLVQAATVAFGISKIFTWVSEGGVLDKAALEADDADFGGALPALIAHGMNGMILIPLVALLLLIVSFWAKVPRGTLLAAVILGLIVVQIVLGSAHMPVTALVHGINALLIFAAAFAAGAGVGVASAGLDLNPSRVKVTKSDQERVRYGRPVCSGQARTQTHLRWGHARPAIQRRLRNVHR